MTQGLSTPKPIVVQFCQDALEKSQGLGFPIALRGGKESPSFIYSLIHANNINVPGMRDSGGKDPVLSSRSSLAWGWHGSEKYKVPWGSSQGFLSQTPEGKAGFQGEEALLSQSSGTSQEVPVRPEPPLLPASPDPIAPKSLEAGAGSSLTWLLPFTKRLAQLPRW